MNLLKEIEEANEKAWRKKLRLQGAARRVRGCRSGRSLEAHDSGGAGEVGQKQNWSRSLLTIPEDLTLWAAKFGKDITNTNP